MVRAILEAQARWEAHMKAQAEEEKIEKKWVNDKRPTIHRYFLAGENQSHLWRGTYKEGDTNMIMYGWVRNPYAYDMIWSISFRGEWAKDKQLSIKEITVFEANHKFPGCTVGILS
jgi:hypothetical protein